MGERFDSLSDTHQRFIAEQHIFFVATATAESAINCSPKGMDSLRVLDAQRVAWLNLTGSGNETAAHVLHDGRMTIMFCAFSGAPLIMRLYGQATVIHPGESEWDDYAELFPAHPGRRQIFILHINLVQTSCGYGVPLLDYHGERPTLQRWAEAKGESGIREYWRDTNQTTIDGIPTHIVERSEESPTAMD